ncbi:hypothetical protein NDU88_004210 [Pleurodeles waltl]|uniref:Uncharacterized protein n=1 Tax=Pleurodeles waltl TaxID=8319 RepID=A0AAV7M5Q7_PLEWA|nr:hypothetical protein NDU88_004210 [Pleurodeles waltl]
MRPRSQSAKAAGEWHTGGKDQRVRRSGGILRPGKRQRVGKGGRAANKRSKAEIFDTGNQGSMLEELSRNDNNQAQSRLAEEGEAEAATQGRSASDGDATALSQSCGSSPGTLYGFRKYTWVGVNKERTAELRKGSLDLI